MKNLLIARASSISLCLIVFSFASIQTQSYEAMTESDLDDISGQAGIDILSIYGAPSAGLVSEELFNENSSVPKGATLTVGDLIRGELNPDKDSNDKINNEVANKQLRFIEDREFNIENKSSPPLHFNEDPIKEKIEASKQRILTNKSPNSNSETRYTEGNHNLVMQELANGVVRVIHDVTIDLIKIENLTFDDNATSLGNIYLTNFKYNGTTNTFIHD